MTPIITPEQAVALGLIFTRVIGIFMSFPFLNTNQIPLNIRIFFVVAVSFYLMNLLDIKVNIADISVLTLTLYIIKELVLGFLLGLIVNIFVTAFSYAAEVISYFMGLTIVNVFDPTFGQISMLDRYFILIFYIVFFVSGAYQLLIGGLIMSFKILPVYNYDFNGSVFQFVLEKTPLIFSIGFQIAFPFVLILFIINITLALINRLIPQINVFIVGLPMQIFIGLAALAIGASTIIFLSVTLLDNMTESYLKAIQIIGK